MSGWLSKWRAPSIAMLAVVAVLLSAVGSAWSAMRIHENKVYEIARADCLEASEQLRTIRNQYYAYHQGEAAEAYALHTEDVADSTKLIRMNNVYETSAPSHVACNTDMTNEMNERTQHIQQHIEWYTEQSSQLRETVNSVIDSRNYKTMVFKRLTDKVIDAQRLLDRSDGKVADTATRDRLQHAYEAASGMTKSNDVVTINQCNSDLDNAITEVSTSMERKKEDDERKAQEEAKAREEKRLREEAAAREREAAEQAAAEQARRDAEAAQATAQESVNGGATNSQPTYKHYKNCKAVWNDLGHGITSSDPGYSPHLDADGDGKACEIRPRY